MPENGAAKISHVPVLELSDPQDGLSVEATTPQELLESNFRIETSFSTADPRTVRLTLLRDEDGVPDVGPSFVVHREELLRALEL